jgi:ribosomal protein S18 acetylase RimI-like enzyme
MTITYKINSPVSANQFIELLQQSTLAERRPVDDYQCMHGMVTNSNLMPTAWDDQKLVGIARCITDFEYACYVSDLAVHQDYQRQGIGKELLTLTQQQLKEKCKLILIAAPAANDYYRHIGFSNNPRCWILGHDENII